MRINSGIVISQSQNVYLLNNQANSTKPKRKLNLNAAAFNTSSFNNPNANKEAGSKNISDKSDHFGSYSEPNSARSLDYKPLRNENMSKKKNINYTEGYSSDMGESKVQDNHFIGYTNPYNQQQFYANPPFGYNNPNNNFSQNQYAPPPSQFFSGNYYYQFFYIFLSFIISLLIMVCL